MVKSMSMNALEEDNYQINKNTEREEIICLRIEGLREKIIDRTRKNPLISTKFSDRSNSVIRLVDVTPEILLELISSREVRIVSLPDLATNPKDENTREFQNALAEARLNDEIYLNQLDAIDQESDDAPNVLTEAERELKDRLRQKLNMSPRQTRTNLSLQQHAKNHNITPHYELPIEEKKHANALDIERDIQTLTLPDVMERRLNALYNKEKTWEEETGISVLHAAFGFLEWIDGNNSTNQFSPLILMPIQLKKKRTKSGQEFWITSDGAEPEENQVLAEKLRLEFNITLPKYNAEQGIENYLKDVIEQTPKNIKWTVKRWAAIGVFPSARLAMYHDLDTNNWDFAKHPLIAELFGGSTKGHNAPNFADDYNIDEPEIENKVPYLIADADSSQFSAIVDIANGKNLAVEGPPGTGKSQTIVNTIAASLGAGKKVLFVAEKSAALEVVKARLEAYGIGDFLLPLQANRSSKEQVFSSIRNRIEMQPCSDPKELDRALATFKQARNELKHYVDTLSAVLPGTDFTVHSILGGSIKSSNILDTLPPAIKNFNIPKITNLTSDKLKDILLKFEQVEKARKEASNAADTWNFIQLPNINQYQVKKIVEEARESASLYSQAVKLRSQLTHFKLNVAISSASLENIDQIINQMTQELLSNLSKDEIHAIENLATTELVENIKSYLQQIEIWQTDKHRLLEHFTKPLSKETLESLIVIKNIYEKHDFEQFKKDHLQDFIDMNTKSLEDITQAIFLFEQVEKISYVLSNLPASDIIKISNIFSIISKQALALRSKDLDDPSLQSILIKQIAKARALKTQQDTLDKTFHLMSLPAFEIIENHAKILEESGVFSFFSKEYRIAKNFYKSISKATKFNSDSAAQELRQLSEWIYCEKEFSENKTVQSILGIHYEGINTDFAPFEEVIKLFNDIDDNFIGFGYTEIRTFLKYGDIAKIQSLPKISNQHEIHIFSDLTLKDLYKQADNKKQIIAECSADILTLQSNIIILKNYNTLSQVMIQQLIENLEQLLTEQQDLQNNNAVKAILGPLFKGEETKENELTDSINLVLHLIRLPHNERAAFIHCLRNNLLDKLKELMAKIFLQDQKAYSSIRQISKSTESSPEIWIKNKTPEKIAEFLKLASEDKNGLSCYSRLIAAKNNLNTDGYNGFVELMYKNQNYKLCKTIEALIIQELLRIVYQTYGEILARYNGKTLDYYRKLLQESDNKVIKLGRDRLQSQLFSNANPPSGNGLGRKSSYTELALLKNEIAKKNRYIPVRNLTHRAAEALLELKPCWMMSPLAVAQYLPNGGIEFDLLIIDEASQMTPEDAVGAFMRTKQVMVVGDTNQLPPSGFFRQLLEDEEADDDEKVTEESILEMANLCFAPIRRLRWHYRSRHSSLIAFSNRHVYDDKLVVFPSAQEDNPEMGVSYIKVNGLYSTGTNPEEAKAMIDAIIEFMSQYKDKSLGVVVLNRKQCDLLTEEMNYAIEKNDNARAYKEQWEEKNEGLESFFIKNLENVQGDERDVIFIGTVYGPEKEDGPVMQRFGPINGFAGKRRLNVLLSRAKERIVTFSSMKASDIRAEEDDNAGVYMLARWLEYAASGVLYSGEYSNKEPDSPLEEHVIQQIKSIGCEAVPQVGVKGFSIDIGVKHPDWPHGFIMGVECDGATYHSSVSARDRDRLRQDILEGLGWHIYRIWSTDWFEDSIRETKKLRDAIEKRVLALNEVKYQ